MQEKIDIASLMKPIRDFLKDRKIRYRDLAKVMMYSASHVGKCLSGCVLPKERFMRSVGHYIAEIIAKENQEHQNVKDRIREIIELAKEKDPE